jgi:outer membrane protein assembly factor BamB
MPLRRLAFCLTLLALASFAHADDWPQWLGPQRDGIWREAGILSKFPESGPKIRWRAPIGAGYSGPAVADGRVYVTDRVASDKVPTSPFDRGHLAGVERIFCLDAKDGSIIWQKEYDCAYTVSYAAGPRATPSVAGGKVYTLGAEGDLRCYNTNDGKLVWSKKFSEGDVPTPMWGYSASPLVDRDKVICLGNKENIAIAFNKDTGDAVWKNLAGKEPGYAPPVIYEFGGKRQLIMWHPAALVSLNPETGQEYWSERHEVKQGLSIAMPRLMDDLLFVSSAYEGSLMMRMDKNKPAATRLWKRGGKSERTTDSIHILCPTPLLRDGLIFGVEAYGQLRCLKAENGDRLWETFAATTNGEMLRWASAFIIGQGDRCIVANDQGDIIIAKMTAKGYEELTRAHILEPTNKDANRPVVWSHPAFANKCIYMRNDKEIVCLSMSAE